MVLLYNDIMRKVGDFVSIRGIIFLVFAVLGAILNYTARPVGNKLNIPALRLKVIALVIVVISISLLFIFGK